MKQYETRIGAVTIPVYSLNTVVVGTGAAGYNAADRLWQYGQKDIAIVTEGICMGTSRNTGSDKQTYYKLSLAGSDSDSIRKMAQTLFDGQCMDGDTALCEAALSAQGFLRLAELGVAFPRNRYGEYIGYKTDHDPGRRATSAGPYTSRMMTERLQQAVEDKGIPTFDRLQAVKILTGEQGLEGLLCLRLDAAENKEAFVAFRCKNVIYATGGPAGMYADSVYPLGHCGASGIALEAGVKGQNLTEWQYGLASVAPRWNVSGTYMQALPRFISTNAQGGDEREFLYSFFQDEGRLLDMVFFKGYQWPFDVRKIREGSSVIDLLVYLETGKGRRVYLDFRRNPGDKAVDFEILCPEAGEYLKKAGACFGTPLDRLRHMNSPALEFYRDKGVDLAAEPLEIALCAQHNNGGLGVDCWWHTSLEGFFAAGEAAGSHGVYRPGGSALNAGQAGSARAAQNIAARRHGSPSRGWGRKALEAMAHALELSEAVTDGAGAETLSALWQGATRRMSRVGGPIRHTGGIEEAIGEIKKERAAFLQRVKTGDPRRRGEAFRLWDLLTCQLVYLQAMADYAAQGGKSRGSALYIDPAGEKPGDGFPGELAFTLDDGSRGHLVQEAAWSGEENRCIFSWRTVRPLPGEEDFFETVWRDYREHGNVL